MKKCDQDKMVFTAYITLKNGKRLYAKQVGKKAFCFLDKKSKEQNNKCLPTMYRRMCLNL